MPKIRDVFLGANQYRYRKSKFIANGKVYDTGLRSLNEGDRTIFESARSRAQNETDVQAAELNYRRRLLVMMVMELRDNPTCNASCDGCSGCISDTPEFQYDDIIAMERVDYGTIGPLYNDACELAVVSRADIEELAKNSVATAGASSPEKSA